MTSFDFLHILARGLTVAAVLSLAACGGGGGGGLAPVVASGGVIGGTGFKGPVGNAAVTAYAVSGGSPGAPIGTATTDAGGQFSLQIGSYSGPVLLQLASGAYTDEATGTMMNMASGDVMTAVLPTVAAGSTVSGIHLTPLTSMAQTAAQHLSGGMTDANIAAANAVVGSYFLVSDILHVPPMNPLLAGSGSTASQDAMNYGMVLAAMSQYAKGLGMTFSSAFVTAMMNDASDGVMDGRMGQSAVMMGGMGASMAMPASAGTSGLASAMSTFLVSGQNKSGISVAMMQTLLGRLSGSNGQLFVTKPPVAQGTIGGAVFNGLKTQATVRAFAINNGTMGAQIAGTATDARGNFMLPIGTYTGPVMLQAIGVTYADMATGGMMTMAAADTMTMVMPTIASGASVTGVWVTPLTSMAQARAQAMTGGMLDANIMAANAAMGNYFMVSDILRVQPMNALVPGSAATATQDMKNCGAAIAAMSQYASSLNMPVSAAFITAMMHDASDGMMDGRTNGTPISMSMGGMMGPTMMQPSAGTSGLAMAMSSFLGSRSNLSGATASDMAALIQKLTSSTGQL